MAFPCRFFRVICAELLETTDSPQPPSSLGYKGVVFFEKSSDCAVRHLWFATAPRAIRKGLETKPQLNLVGQSWLSYQRQVAGWPYFLTTQNPTAINLDPHICSVPRPLATQPPKGSNASTFPLTNHLHQVGVDFFINYFQLGVDPR